MVAEHVPAAEALGRVTAAPVHARGPLPRSDCAAMDGIAVAAAAVTAAAAAAAAAGAGDGDRVVLPRGTFEWIDTGDPMPPGTDTVIVRERVVPRDDGGVLVTGRAAGGDLAPRGGNVRAAAEDFAAGELLVPAGRRLRPADLAAAAAGGHATLAVARRPAVAIIPTGDEIRPVGAALRHGDITDTNSLMLAARCRRPARGQRSARCSRMTPTRSPQRSGGRRRTPTSCW